MLAHTSAATTPAQADARFTAADSVQFTAVDGEVILIDLIQERFFGLNEVGAALWLGLTEGLPLGAVLDRLQAEFDVTREVLEADVAPMLVLFLERGWLIAAATGAREA
jgi:hypothetical protein